MNTKQLMAAMALTALTITACKKDSEEPAPPTVSTTANVSLEFRFVNGENGYTLDTLLADSLGHAIKVSSAKFYVSAIHAENEDDVIVGDWDDAFLLVDASATTNTFSIGTMNNSTAMFLGVRTVDLPRIGGSRSDGGFGDSYPSSADGAIVAAGAAANDNEIVRHGSSRDVWWRAPRAGVI